MPLLSAHGTTWVCAACGREGASREELFNRDASCGTWANLVWIASIERNEQGQVIKAMSADEQAVG